MTLTLKAATATAGTLGFPSKMPGTSYGLPAQACITGARLAKVPGSTCHNCYAFRGNYIFRDVKKSQATRLAAIADPAWVSAMVTLITRTHALGRGRNGPISPGWHRWHDSGDIQSLEHLAKIAAVARGTPHIRHWLPTRELTMVIRYIESGGVIPDNLVIRVSATMVDGPASRAWRLTSGVHSRETHFSPLNDERPMGHICPAPHQDGKCGPCRACWSPNVPHVTYHLH